MSIEGSVVLLSARQSKAEEQHTRRGCLSKFSFGRICSCEASSAVSV